MNPADSTERSNTSLPIPMGSQPSMPFAPAGSMPLVPDSDASPLSLNHAQAPILATTPLQTAMPSDVPGTAPTSIVVPQAADDSDLIEKEWVDKAKRIVQANLEDPYEQSRELTMLKAEYMKKRYNKDIRLGE